jgi:hypothetical protein
MQNGSVRVRHGGIHLKSQLLRRRRQKDCGQRPTQAKVRKTLSQKKKKTAKPGAGGSHL